MTSVSHMNVHMKSGKVFRVDAQQPNEHSAEMAAKEFYDGLDFASTTSLLVGAYCVLFKEVELFEFVEATP